MMKIGEVEKFMRTQRSSGMGQVTVEYFILFAVVAALTVLSLTTFDEDVRKTCTEFFKAATTDVVAQR